MALIPGRPVWKWATTSLPQHSLGRTGFIAAGVRSVHLEPSPNSLQLNVHELEGANTARERLEETSSDARFEVLGASSSLLSVSLNASQDLYTRRGTLVGISGGARNVISSLSFLSPLQRFATGVPFLYQKVSSPSPTTALIASKSSSDSFIVVPLDGRRDWVVAQRAGLLAWTGDSLILKPRTNLGLSISHWGNTFATGRGLLALAGRGQIFEMSLNKGDEYVVHPSHVLAYTSTPTPPAPFRLPFHSFRLQLPRLAWTPSIVPASISQSAFIVSIRESRVWKGLVSGLHFLATRFRAAIFGDRLFLKFAGPATILVQSRGGRLVDVLGDREINEIARSDSISVEREARRENKEIKQEAEKLLKMAEKDASSTDQTIDLKQEVR